MTDLDAILRAVLADPHDDTPRLVYAEICDGLAGVVACPRCGGSGKHDLNPYELAARYGTYRAGLMLDAARCVACAGSGSVSNGMAERAEFVRVQCELASLSDECDVFCDDHPARPVYAASAGVCTLHHRRRELRSRERELFDASKAAWFGGDRWAVLLLPDDDADLMPDLTTAVVRRGFVDEIRTGLSQFVGDRCPVCDIGPGVRRYPTQGGDWTEGACDHCHGTGRVGLDLAAVFARHPVRSVVFPGREPYHAPGSGEFFWVHTAQLEESPATIPDPIWMSPTLSGMNGRHRRAKSFPTRAAALSALSLACVNLGRAAAGLDPLT